MTDLWRQATVQWQCGRSRAGNWWCLVFSTECTDHHHHHLHLHHRQQQHHTGGHWTPQAEEMNLNYRVSLSSTFYFHLRWGIKHNKLFILWFSYIYQIHSQIHQISDTWCIQIWIWICWQRGYFYRHNTIQSYSWYIHRYKYICRYMKSININIE